MLVVVNSTECDCLSDLYDLCWSGAIDTLDEVSNANKGPALIDYLSDIFCETVSTTKLNDFLWFDREMILSDLGITDDDEDEE